MSLDEKILDWAGCRGDGKFYTEADLKQSIKELKEKIIQIKKEYGTESQDQEDFNRILEAINRIFGKGLI